MPFPIESGRSPQHHTWGLRWEGSCCRENWEAGDGGDFIP